MNSERWERAQQMFHDALEMPASERPGFLHHASDGDGELESQVNAMLEEDARGSSVLDAELAHVADDLLTRPSAGTQKIFGPYRLGKLLGEGGMGVVFLAERDDLKSMVAVKILRDAWMSPARRARFLAEQRTLAQLNHPSIARLYDADTLDDKTPFFAMEYVDGVPLTDYCEQHNSSIEDRLRLFRTVSEAVDYAHRHAVIHRDLKPSNILVKADGTPKLLDFGIAKQLDPQDQAAAQTRTGLRLMTPAYAAPEQIRGEQVGIGSDVYSLGVILYELLARRLPFDLTGLAPGEAEMRLLEAEPPKPGAGEDLDVLCLTAMHKDPVRRYRSVEALIRDLDHYLNGEPLDARPDTFRYRLGKFVKRNRRSVIASTVGIALLVTLVIFFTVRLSKARDAAVAEAARTRRIQQFMLDLFNGGDKTAGPAEDLRVVTLLDRGVQGARSLDSDPAVQAELFETLGGIYQKLGNLDRADSLLGSALDRRKAIFGPSDVRVSESLADLGLLRADQARYDDAEKLVRQGLEAAERLRPRDDASVAKAKYALGTVLEARGNYTEALPNLEEAVRLYSARSPVSEELAGALTQLAATHFYAGHFDVSKTVNQRVLQMDRQLHGERHPSVAEDLSSLGAIEQEQGHYPEAEAFYRQAVDITRSFYGNDHNETALRLTQLSRALIYEKRWDEAVDLLRQALAIQQRVFGPGHNTVAGVMNELGNVAYMRDQEDEAEMWFRKALEIYKTVYHDRHSVIAVEISNIGGVYLDRKDYPKAEQLFREAVARFTDTLSADHVSTGIAQLKLGRALLRQNRYREAEEHLLAGYRIVSKQASPSVSWLKSARKDLVQIYDALGEPDKAREFRPVEGK
jgi:serine/threonine-protein kinase